MLLSVERGVAAPLADRFDKLIFSEDVQAKDATGELAAGRARSVGCADDPACDRRYRWPILRISTTTSRPSRSPIVRDDALGVAGIRPLRAGGRRRCTAREAHEAGAVEASEETAETLRIEAGRPRFGIDMNTDTIPLEAGLEDRAISFTKGCYVGQEVIIRVMHRGHGRVARRLVSIALPDGTVPARGDKIHLERSRSRRDHQRDGVAKVRRAARAGLRAARPRRSRHRAHRERLTGSRLSARELVRRRLAENPAPRNSSRVIQRSSWPSIGCGSRGQFAAIEMQLDNPLGIRVRGVKDSSRVARCPHSALLDISRSQRLFTRLSL